MEIKKLGDHEIMDFISIIEIFNAVFENKQPIPEMKHLSGVLSNPNFIVFVVKVNGRVTGGLTIHVLPAYYSLRPSAYIYDVGITPDFQGQGQGKALITEVLNFCRHSNFELAYVEAESDDHDAVSFYRKLKFSSEMNATHFTYTFFPES